MHVSLTHLKVFHGRLRTINRSVLSHSFFLYSISSNSWISVFAQTSMHAYVEIQYTRNCSANTARSKSSLDAGKRHARSHILLRFLLLVLLSVQMLHHNSFYFRSEGWLHVVGADVQRRAKSVWGRRSCLALRIFTELIDK